MQLYKMHLQQLPQPFVINLLIMIILLTGSTGYIAQRLLPVLLEAGHEVICCVRDKNRFNTDIYQASRLRVVEVDFLQKILWKKFLKTLMQPTISFTLWPQQPAIFLKWKHLLQKIL